MKNYRLIRQNATILAAIFDFWKSHVGGERPPGLNFIETLRTIEKSKETIVKRPRKVMGPASGLLEGLRECCKAPPPSRFWDEAADNIDFGVGLFWDGKLIW